MTDSARFERNRAMLQQCYGSFRTLLALTLAQMQGLGYRPRIQCAWRSEADERRAYETGHSHVLYGFHNATGKDGQPEALAADVLEDDFPLNPTRPYLLDLARIAHQNKLETGLLWDLPINMRIALTAALDNGSTWEGRVGFDPTHVQVTAITIEQARRGLRPDSPNTMKV